MKVPTLHRAMPVAFDWRNVNGKNYVTPVKNQVGNSCGAFAATAALESAALRAGLVPDANIDLAELTLCSCPGGGCDNLHLVAAFLRSTGLPSETCYPWNSPTGNCANACSGWQGKTFKLVNWKYYYDPDTIDEVKTLILEGPVVTGMNIPPDFWSYTKDVYSDVWELIAVIDVTKESCTAAAKKAGFAYAGLQDGHQCFAGNVLGYKRVDDRECDKPCIADSSQKCGGAWRNSIYSTGVTIPAGYQGCFTDDGNRALPNELTAADGSHSVMVVGYDDRDRSFIVKNSWGTDWGDAGYFKISYSEFKSRIVDFGRGVHTYSGAVGPPSDPATSYQGCYVDKPTRALPKVINMVGDVTIEKCIEAAYRQGFAYAGLQAGYQCFAGNQLSYERVYDNDCNTPCVGNKEETCGGAWRNSIYFTGPGSAPPPVVPAPAALYKGCYTDDPNRALPAALTLDADVTVERCIEAATKQGYSYAGVQAGYQCFAGNRIGDQAASVVDCMTPCKGNRFEFCGGTWRNAVYATGTSCADGRWCPRLGRCVPICDLGKCETLSSDGLSCNSVCSAGWSCSGGQCCRDIGSGIKQCQSPLLNDPCK